MMSALWGRLHQDVEICHGVARCDRYRNAFWISLSDSDKSRGVEGGYDKRSQAG
jgi:hypothetical protein